MDKSYSAFTLQSK